MTCDKAGEAAKICRMPRFFVLLIVFACVSAGSAQELTPSHREAFARCRELQKAGDWEGAREVAAELVAAFAGAPPSQHRLAFVNELANLEQRLGAYGAALPASEDGLATARELLGEESAVVARLKNNLAALHQTLGSFPEAETLNREALATQESLEGKGGVGTVPAMNNLAGLLWCIGDLDGAEALYREALAIRTRQLGDAALDTARSRANLGGLLFYRDEIDEAADLIRDAVSIFEEDAGPTHPDTLEVLLFLGEIERATGRPDAALQLYLRVLDGRVAAFGTREHVEVAEALRRIGDARREMGNNEEARAAYLESDALYLKLLREDHPDRREGLYGLGLAAIASGDREGAKNAATACAEVEFRNFDAMLEFTDERQRLAYQDMFKSQHLLANLGDAEALAAFLLRQKGVVSDSLVAEARLARGSDDPRAESARRALAAARAEFRSVFLGGGGAGRSIADYEALVRERHRELLEVIGAKDLSPAGSQATLAELQGALGEGEAILDYLRYDRYSGKAEFEERYGLVVVTSASVEFFDCGSAAEFDAIIAAMVPFFGSGEPGESADADARQVMERLHRGLVAPAAARIAGATSLIVCPEASLSFVPFACLVGPDGRFLIESHDLRYVTSSREMLRRAATPDPSRGAILVGNPSFKTGTVPRTTGLPDRRGLLATFSAAGLADLAAFIEPLEGAGREVDLLGPILEKRLGTPVSTIKGADATEAALREGVRRPHILHIATHGVYLPGVLAPADSEKRDVPLVPTGVAGFQNPMFASWLALAGSGDTVAAWSQGTVPDPGSDGVLMANEVAELDLDGTLLVALSACDTASGEATSGDGVLGLRRGFRLAGAENIISTLWPIADQATVILMQEFYEGLAITSPHVSLSATQRKWLVALRDKTEVKDGDPIPAGGFYWAVNLAGPFLLGR
jgi:CHAT domain-containing protein